MIAVGLMLFASRKKMARMRQNEVARGAMSARWAKWRDVWYFFGSIAVVLLGAFLVGRGIGR